MSMSTPTCPFPVGNEIVSYCGGHEFQRYFVIYARPTPSHNEGWLLLLAYPENTKAASGRSDLSFWPGALCFPATHRDKGPADDATLSYLRSAVLCGIVIGILNPTECITFLALCRDRLDNRTQK